MKLIKPSYEILPQSSGLDGVYKQIEIAGRICYKSSDKITPDSAKGFVEKMIASYHGAMLEHGTVYLRFPENAQCLVNIANSNNKIIEYLYDRYYGNKYSKVKFISGEILGTYYVVTNYRVLVENNWLSDLQYICEPTEFHEKRVTVRFICDRGVSHEFVRHRVFSFAQESTRYCNYSKDKFDNELTFIEPLWLIRGQDNNQTATFLDTMHFIEDSYLLLLKENWSPQQARAILPNSLKTELIMTGFVSDWKHFFLLRNSEAAHPDARNLAKPLHEEFIKNKWL